MEVTKVSSDLTPARRLDLGDRDCFGQMQVILSRRKRFIKMIIL